MRRVLGEVVSAGAVCTNSRPFVMAEDVDIWLYAMRCDEITVVLRENRSFFFLNFFCNRC